MSNTNQLPMNELTHFTFAEYLMKKYGDTYCCASIENNIWYEFQNHRWIKDNGVGSYKWIKDISVCSLRKRISNELVTEYENLQRDLYETAIQKQGDAKDKYYNEMNRITKIIKKLNNSDFITGVIRECAELAYDPKFLKNLDENINLICFEDGVYDLSTNEFRNGRRDDYISMCVGYNYLNWNKNNEYYPDVKHFFQKILPDKTMRNFLKTVQAFFIFTGPGEASKSKLMELMRHALGDLLKSVNIKLLEKNNALESVMAGTKGVRMLVFDEYIGQQQATNEINTGFLKMLTGNDSAVDIINDTAVCYRQQFKPFLLCNRLPKINPKDATDDGLWRRIKVISMPSKENDLEIKPLWRQTLMAMLIKYYTKYRMTGLVYPELVEQHTIQYRERCDIFLEFFSMCLQKTANSEDSISCANLYNCMKGWYRENYDGKCPNTKEFRSYMTHRMTGFNIKTDSLIGYKIKTAETDTPVIEKVCEQNTRKIIDPETPIGKLSIQDILCYCAQFGEDSNNPQLYFGAANLLAQLTDRSHCQV